MLIIGLVLQSELCSQSLVDIVQAVVGGADGCLFCYGHARLGEWLHQWQLKACSIFLHIIGIFNLRPLGPFFFLGFYAITTQLCAPQIRPNRLVFAVTVRMMCIVVRNAERINVPILQAKPTQ